MMFAWCNLEAAATITVRENVTAVPILMDEDDWDALRHTAHSSEVYRFVAQLCGVSLRVSVRTLHYQANIHFLLVT